MTIINGTPSEHSNNSVGLLISILVRYPELATLHYDQRRQTMRLSFLLTRLLSEDEFTRFESLLRRSLDAYAMLERRPYSICELRSEELGTVTSIELTRDVASLVQQELALIIAVVRDAYGEDLVIDRGEAGLDEDPAFQEELIEQMLDDLRGCKQDRNLMAFREEGRVLVFNK